MIISFDLGFKNLGMCVLDKQYHILEWKNLKIDSSKIKEIISVLDIWISLVIEKKNNKDEEIIIVLENQPYYNRKTSRLLVIMETFFIVAYPLFVIQKKSSNSKWKFLQKNVPSLYTERKKQCVLACMEQLDIYETQESKWKDWFCTQNKKDDLADCYLQGLTTTTLRN